MRICLVRLSALGDILMFLPLVRLLQQSIKGVEITWVISKPAYYLVEGLDNVHFVVIDKPKGFKDYWRFKQQFKGQSFDVLIAAQASLRANLLYPCITAKRKIGYDNHRAKDGHRWFVKEQIAAGEEHTLEGFLKFAEALGIKEKNISWQLPVSEEEYAFARQFIDPKRKTLIINPAASKAERSWLTEHYIALIKATQNRWDLQIVLTGGPGAYDSALTEAISKETKILNLAGQTRPKQLLAVIGLADLVVCPDTGPAHMAAAMGTPVIALHAVTNPEISGPYSYRHLAINAYPQAVKQLLNMPYDKTPWGTQVHDPRAMSLIHLDAVLNRMAEVLEAS